MKQSLRFTFPWSNSKLNWPLSSTENEYGRCERIEKEKEAEKRKEEEEGGNLRRCENERGKSRRGRQTRRRTKWMNYGRDLRPEIIYRMV